MFLNIFGWALSFRRTSNEQDSEVLTNTIITPIEKNNEAMPSGTI